MSIQWNEVTAVFGGTFDPPHLGHREAVRGLFHYPGVRRVVILPAGSPPLKLIRTSVEDRIQMTRLCFSKTPSSPYPDEVELDLRETRRILEPDEKSYTFHSLQELRQEHSQIAFVIGTDQLEKLPQWYRFPEILGLTHWIVLERKPFGRERSLTALQPLEASGVIQAVASDTWKVKLAPGSNAYLKLVPTDAPRVSSTEIRETLIRTGEPPANTLFAPVLRYLNEKHLYGTHSL